MTHLRLGLNIDHVATLRNARGGVHPDPLRAVKLAMEAGVDGITVHLREDRRHIRDNDVARIKAEVALPLNFEMAATGEMLAIALATKPHACCLVPESRKELTTEGGLEVVGQLDFLRGYISKLKQGGIRVSLFIDPSEAQVRAAAEAGADIVEFHTGTYCHDDGGSRAHELQRIQQAVTLAAGLGLECHAGHGLDYANVGPIAAIPQIVELNIGHFLIGEAVFVGLKESIRKMREAMRR